MAAIADRKNIRRAEEIFRTLSASAKDLLIYGEDHPRFSQTCVQLRELVLDYVRSNPALKGLTFLVISDQVHLGRIPLPNLGPAGAWLVEILDRHGMEGFRVSSTISAPEVVELVRCIVGRSRSRTSTPSPGASGPQHTEVDEDTHDGFRVVPCGQAEPIFWQVSDDGPVEAVTDPLSLPHLRVSRKACKSILTTYRSVLNNLRQGRVDDYSSLLNTTQAAAEWISREGASVLPSITETYFDEFTFHHSVNVCLISTVIASKLVHSAEVLNRVALAALLHDIGKNFIPAEILHKPARLTDSEVEVMQRHTTLGAKTLLEMTEMDPLCVSVAFGHHIHDDDLGYPRTRLPYECDWVTRLVSIVDIYEALTAVRPYKPSLSSLTAFKIMSSMPGLTTKMPLVKLLYDSVGPFPVGTVVLLSSGARARIRKVHPSHPLLPTVEVLTDPDGTRLEEPRTIDLATPAFDAPGGDVIRIRRTLVRQRPGPASETSDYGSEPVDLPQDLLGDDRALMEQEG